MPAPSSASPKTRNFAPESSYSEPEDNKKSFVPEVEVAARLTGFGQPEARDPPAHILDDSSPATDSAGD
ncbi:MAG TPA: hypothetical protein VMS87_10215, partial [Roseiarcus sp.]|nr:hypothetical protein [Roseiarcus sp.]